MGLLPSQKYDVILKEFCEYVEQRGVIIGVYQEVDETIIKDFLKLKDNNEWESQRPQEWGFDEPFLLEIKKEKFRRK